MIGEIRGMNVSWYHVFPRSFTRMKRVIIPARNGMPR